MSTIIHCVFAGKLPINIDTAKSAIENSILVKHPRFTSLLVTDSHCRGHWRKTHVDIDRHIIVHHDRVGEVTDDQEAINDYLADLSVSSPLDTDKPPWEIHLLMAHKCAVFRLHHALGDGISLMSALLSCCRRADGPDQLPQINSSTISKRNNDNNSIRWWSGNIGSRVWRVVMVLWNTAVIVLELMLRSLWKMDKRTVVSGGGGVELWPRKLATAKFRLDDMKTVKTSVAEATINDVLFGVISLGLSRYLDIRSPKAAQEGVQLTGLAMVNLRAQPGLQDLSDMMKTNSKTRWGNQFGIILLPVYYHRYHGGSDPLLYVKRAKAMVDRKKQSLEAYFSYKIGFLVMSLLGSKFAGLLNYRICCNTTFIFSNVVGPKEELTIAGNPVEYIRAITMHMVSYAGRADMQILVAKDIIPDPQVLAKCFEDALFEMKEAAEAAIKT